MVTEPAKREDSAAAAASRSPAVRIAMALCACAFVLFGLFALISAARVNYEQDVTAQTGMVATAEMAARAVENRLAVLMARARMHALSQPTESAAGFDRLRRVAAVPDPLIDQFTVLPSAEGAQTHIRLQEGASGPLTVLQFPADEAAPGGAQISLVLVRDWLNRTLVSTRTQEAVFLAVAPDGRIASAFGPSKFFAALGLTDRVPMTLLAEASAFVAPEPGPRSAAHAATQRDERGKALYFAASHAAPGITLAVAAPAPSGLFSWRLKAAPFAGLSLVFAALGLGLFAIIVGQARAQQRATHERRTNDELIRLVLDTPSCGLWDWDVARGRLFWSARLMAMVGRPARGTWLTLPESHQLLHIEDIALLERIRDVLRNGAPSVQHIVRLRALSGQPVWCLVHLQPWPGTEERIIGVALNVTEFVEARRQAETRKDRILNALEGSREALAIYDNQRSLLYANAGFHDWLGKCHLQNQRPSLDRFLVPLVAQGYESVGTHKLDPNAPAPGAYLLRHRRGTQIRLWIGAFADDGLFVQLREEQNALVGLDVAEEGAPETLLRALEQSRQDLETMAADYAQERNRAREAHRAKSEFLANMSHELKTPLNAIIGFSEIMQAELYGALGDGRYRSYADDILKSGRELSGIIDDILEMSKIEAGRVDLHIDRLDIAELVETCVRMVEPSARDSGVVIDNFVAEPFEVAADRRATKRIVMNLLTNAIKFTPRGGSIKLEARLVRDTVELAVSDTGIGIAPQDLERIGRPFEQVEHHDSRQHSGSGLGLAISRAFAEMQGGKLRIESVQGVGTTVRLTFPPAPAEAPGLRQAG